MVPPSPRRRAVEEYLRTTYEPDMEYVAGQLVERSAGEYLHSRLQALTSSLLISREEERQFSVFTEQRVRVSSEPRYRIPDICVKALPHEETAILERPDLVIEILSPDDRVGEMLKKIADYRDAGIPHIWLADPYERAVFTADETGIKQAINGILETDLVGAVDFNLLFEKMRKRASEPRP